MSNTIVRRAKLSDVSFIAKIHVRSWQAAYSRIMPKDFLDTLSIDERSVMWRKAIEEQSGDTLVAELKGEVMGFANVGSCRDSDLNPNITGEVRAIYVEPDHWRSGIGTKIFAAGLTALLKCNLRDVRLWVLTENKIGRGFYEKHGMSCDGSKKSESLGDIELEELRYKVVLT